MKRLVAILLIVSIIAMTAPSVNAETIYLPKSCLTIGEEAFYEDVSLDEIIVPYGTTSIGSKAFSYTSACSIYIPTTVLSIADDAFAGSSNITICSSSYAYAKKYAESHEISWEEDNTYNLKDEVSSYDQTVPLEENCFETELYDIWEYPSDGIEDPELLIIIEEYNALNAQLADAVEESNESMRNVISSAGNLANDMQLYSISDNNGTIAFSNSEFEYEMSTPAFSGIKALCEETAYTVNNDTIQIEIDNGGDKSYLVIKEGSFCISDDASIGAINTKNLRLLSRAAENDYGITFVESIVNKAQGSLKNMEIAIAAWKVKKAVNVDIAKQAWEKAIKIGNGDEVEAAYSRYWKAQRALTTAESFASKFTVKCIPILGLIATAKNDISSWYKLDAYAQHGHPTLSEASNEVALDIISELNKNIGAGKAYYVADASVSVIGAIAQTQAVVDWLAAMITIVVPGLGEMIAAKATLELIVSLVSAGGGAVLSYLGDKRLQRVEENDALLHTRATGTVIDAISGEIISDVVVKSGRYSTRTDSTGKYILQIEGDSISFSKRGYTSFERDVDSSYQGTLVVDAKMYVLCPVTGYVQNIGGHPISGAKVCYNSNEPDYDITVTTNENGFYTMKVPMGTRTLKAECFLCDSDCESLYVNRSANTCNFILKTGNYTEGTKVYFGNYEQDNDLTNGKEAIEWIVIQRTDTSLTLISKYALDAVPYNTTQTNITWAVCSLRKWLNSDFLYSAFTVEEREKMQSILVKAEKNPIYGTAAGSDTYDKVYLLSITEAETLLHSDRERLCIPTTYAARLVYVDKEYGAAQSWLRSPGERQDLAAQITLIGVISHNSYVYPNRVIRPVICVKLP